VAIPGTVDEPGTVDDPGTVDGDPSGQPGLLQVYNQRTRRLLSDPQAQYWSDVELNDDINQARTRVAADTKCLRQLITDITLEGGRDLYPVVQTINSGAPRNLGLYVTEIISISIYWGNMRIKCQNRSFSEQDAKLRVFQDYRTRPGSMAMQGANIVWINPIPDEDYNSDWDVVLTPPILVDQTSYETIPPVFQALIPFYAAHLAKYSEQSLTEAEGFLKRYYVERQAASWSFFSSRWRDAYRR